MKYSFGSGSSGGVVVIWTGIPGADAQIDLLDGATKPFNMRLCRPHCYTGTDLVRVLHFYRGDGQAMGTSTTHQKASTDER